MYVERLLQIHVALLVALGTFVASIGPGNVWAPLAVLAAGMLSVWFTDLTGRFHVNRVVGNLLGIAVLLFTMPRLTHVGKHDQILAIADLLVCLELIVLFQKKEPRVYWQLVTLSLLQIVIATVWTQWISFGVLVVGYLFVALVTISLLFLYSERLRHHNGSPLRLADSGGGRWPLAGCEPVFSCGTAGRLGVARELFTRILRIALGTLVVSGVFFLAMPRIGQSAWRGLIGGQRARVGFSQTIELGSMGRMLENREPVMKVSFADMEGEPYTVSKTAGGLYLRGAIATQYRDHRWTYPSRPSITAYGAVPSPDYVPPEKLIRQRIVIMPMEGEELFCVWPYKQLRQNWWVLYNNYSNRLVRRPDAIDRPLEFELATSAFDNGVQHRLSPVAEMSDASDLAHLAECLQIPDVQVPRLIEQANAWITRSELPADDRYGRAVYLETMLRDSGWFRYSLEPQPRDAGVDPIDDFVAVHRQGHCEYFATALALMLRSQGIPSRVVIGFHCSEWDELGRYWQVRQLHAHAWVEAYFNAKQLSREIKATRPESQWDQGAWLRLDATPAADEGASAFKFLSAGSNWLDRLWNEYVMSMDKNRQRDNVYAPLARMLEGVWRNLTSGAWWRALLGRDTAGRTNWTDRLRLGAMATAGISLTALLVLRRRRARRADRPGERRSQRARDSEIEFYRRYEALLVRRGLPRPAGWTQRQFAVWLAQRFSADGQAELALLAPQVAEAFYQVRFGHAPLDKSQAEAVEQSLAALAHRSGLKRQEVQRNIRGPR